MKSTLLRHPKKIVAAVVSIIVALLLESQGVPAPVAQGVGVKVGEAVGEAAQQVADDRAER